MVEGKNVIITGCSRGIGHELMRVMYREGANIWACARKPSDAFEQDISELGKNGKGWIKPVYFDLANEEQRKEGVKSILQDKLPIDVLINNAGVAFSGTLHMTPVDKLKDIFEVNYFAAIELLQMVSKKMIRQRSGVIINIASVGGIEANEGYLAYGSSKAALIWATRSISKELSNYGIRVNAIAPGLVHTDMGHYKNKEELELAIARTSMKRMGQPSEIANVALFLASDLSSYITGQILCVDGGRT